MTIKRPVKKRRCIHCLVWQFDALWQAIRVTCMHCRWSWDPVPSQDPRGDRLRALQSQEAHADLCPRSHHIEPWQGKLTRRYVPCS